MYPLGKITYRSIETVLNTGVSVFTYGQWQENHRHLKQSEDMYSAATGYARGTYS